MEKYLSVSEYAELHNKDVGNVRRLLASGRLPGQKAGNQWIIAEGTAYPADKRVSTGKYRNWRKKVALYENRELMKSISSMMLQLRSIYNEQLSEVILYGSYARGTQTEESDVDIALILLGKPSKAATDAMIDCVSSYELECGKVLSVIDISAEKFSYWKDTMPLYKNIRKEGIVLWKAAV